MNEILPWCIGGMLLLIIVVVIFAPKKDSGLSPEHHSELSKPRVKQARLDELRDRYTGDRVAQRWIDVYDGGTEYHGHLRAYADALKVGDAAGESREEQWFGDNYPDV